MIEHHLWLLFLVVGAFWTLLVANGSPSTLEIVKAWAGGVLIGALVGMFAGYAAASVSLDWQWPVGIVVGAIVCIVVAAVPLATKKVAQHP